MQRTERTDRRTGERWGCGVSAVADGFLDFLRL